MVRSMYSPWFSEGVTIENVSTGSALAFGNDLLEHVQVARGHVSTAAEARRAGTTALDLRSEAVWRILEQHERVGDLPGLQWIEVDSRVAGNFGQAGDIAAQHGFSHSQRLDYRHAEALEQRREDERSARLQEPPELGAGDVAGEHDSLGRQNGASGLFELGHQRIGRTRTDQLQVHAGSTRAKIAQRLEESHVVLVRPEVGGVQDKPLWAEAEPAERVGCGGGRRSISIKQPEMHGHHALGRQ